MGCSGLGKKQNLFSRTLFYMEVDMRAKKYTHKESAVSPMAPSIRGRVWRQQRQQFAALNGPDTGFLLCHAPKQCLYEQWANTVQYTATLDIIANCQGHIMPWVELIKVIF